MSNKKRITVGDVIGLFSYPTRIDITLNNTTTLITIEMNKKRNAEKYLSDEILNTKVDAISLDEFKEDTITIQITEKDNEEE